MSTQANTKPSVIPRPVRAATPAMVGPRPTKASLLRASQIKEGNAVGQRKAAVIQRAPEIRKAVVPGNSMTGRVEGGIFKGGKMEGNVPGSRGRVMNGVAAPLARSVVSSNTPRVKKANSCFAPKKKTVHFDEVGVRHHRNSHVCETVPWLLEDAEEYELFEGEIDWETWRAQQEFTLERAAKIGIDAMLARTEKALEKLRLEEEAEERYRRAVQDWYTADQWNVFEQEMKAYQEELEADELAEASRDEDSTWTIYIYGGNPMLDDETMPFDLDDEVFDEILAMSIAQQEELGKSLHILEANVNAYLVSLVIAEERKVKTEMEVMTAIVLEQELLRYAEQVESEEELTEADESSWNLFEFGGNPSLLDEPMPFTLPAPHPDTTFELGDLSVLPSDDMEWLADEMEPKVCSVLANIPEWYVPEPSAQTLLNFERNLNDIAAQGIPISETDTDLWARLRRGLTEMISTKEEAFFDAPETFPFESKYDTLQRSEEMLVDVQFPGKVSPALEALGADDTLLEIDIGGTIQLRLRKWEMLTDMAWSKGPGVLCAALMEWALEE